ncbi:MAG: hypothetical protein IJW20_04875 [Clostridia bacterium]|nr:hypothetical protein [Clostridia bacterium]
MQKCVFDKNTVNEQLVLLSNMLENQREIKKTLLSYLEKVSDHISNTTNTENSEALVSCLSNVQEIFDNIKSNIDKLIELKLFIENISKSTSLNIIDFEKYYNQFIELSEKIETTNNSYNDFMHKLTSIPSIDFSGLNYKKSETLNNLKTEELENKLENKEEIETSAKKVIEENNVGTENVIETIVKENEVVVKENITEIESVIEETTVIEDITETEPIIEAVVEESVTKTEPVIETSVEQPTTEETSIEASTEKAQEKTVVEEYQKEEEKSVEKSVENIPETETLTDEVVEENTTGTKPVIVENDSEINFAEKTLLIDNEAQIAILPYSLLDLEDFFSENPEKYSSINDIIEKEYTVSLDNYENTSISRFKQTFKLAKEKSNLSFFESLNYANKLLFENQVKPIIIAACSTIDELESYLDCLNNDVLEKFDYFTIIDK